MRIWWETIGRRTIILVVVAALLGIAPVVAGPAAPAAATTYQDLILNDHPTGFWRLDDAASSTSVADSAGHGDPATGFLFGSPTLGKDPVTGIDGHSLLFAPTGGFIHLPPPTSDLNRYLSNTITAEMWVKTRDADGALVHTGSGGWAVDLTGGHPVARITDSAPLTATTTINDGRWHHIALVAGVSGDNKITLYLDGHVNATEARSDGGIRYENVSCGSSPNLDVAQGVAGGLDEVAVYDHVVAPAAILARWLAHSPALFRVPDRFGLLASIAMVGDPVNAATGSLTDAQVDMASPSGTFGLDWTRVYNSADATVTALGRGWTPAFSQTATLLSTGEVEIVMPDGRRPRFTPIGSGFDRPAELPATLADLGGGAHRMTFTDGTVWTFDTAGRLASMADASGQTVTITRNGSGDVATAVSSTGASLTLTYTAGSYNRPRLTQVAASDGRTLTYGYSTATLDGQADLVSFTDPNGHTSHYTVDDTGLITAMIDATGITTLALTYDDQGRVATQTTPSGGTTTFTYNDQTEQATAHDSVTDTSLTYQQNNDGRTTGITDPAGHVATRGYDAKGNPTGAVGRLGGATSQTFDELGNLLTSTQPGIGTTTYTYDGSSRVHTVTSPSGGTTTYTYTGTDRVPTTITDAAGGVTTQTVTGGLVTHVTDPDGVQTTFDYDTNRRLTTATDGLGHVTTYEYDTAGRRTEVRTPLGYETITGYDAAGRVSATTAPDGGVTSYTHDNADRVLTVTDPTLAVATNTYDTAGRLASTTKPGGAVTTFDYDGLGQLTVTHETGGGTVTNTYGILGRLMSTTDQLGRTTSYGYDADGNQTTVTTPDGGTTTTAYDPYGRVTSVTDPLNRTTTTAYDTFGRVASTTTPGGHVTSYAYDALDRVSKTTNPRGGDTSTLYTPGGRVSQVLTPDGLTTTSTYDTVGRLASTVTGGLTTTYAYDNDSRQTTVTTPGGLVTTTGYDPAGRVVSITDPAGVTTTKTWTLRGELKTEHVAGAGTVTYTYNPAGTLATVQDAVGNTTSFGYDARDNRTTRTNAAGGIDQWFYDAANQVTSTKDPLSRTTTYTYDPNGRQHTVTDPTGRVTTTTYDLTGQVTSIAYAGGSTTTFTYDADGNRLTASDPSGTTTYTYGPDGTLESTTRPDRHRLAWTYDAAGRQTSRTIPDGTRYGYTYDTAGRLSSITALDILADSFDVGPNGDIPDNKHWTISKANGGTATIAGGQLQLAVADQNNSQATVVSKAADLADEDLLFGYQFSSTSAVGVLSATARNAGTSNYRIEITPNSPTGSLIRKVGSTNTTLGTFTVPVGTGRRWVRFQLQGTALRVRTWNDGATEPSTWAVNITDSVVTQAGDTRIKYARATSTSTAAVDLIRQAPLSGPASTVVGYGYDTNSNLTSETLPAGASRTWAYTNGRLTGLNQNVTGQVFTTTVGYDPSGRVSTETTGTASTTYGYDNASQLKTITPSSGSATTYTYDTLGRRATDKVGSKTTTYTYDAASQLLAQGTTSFTYDAAGRRLTSTTPTATTTYTYDPAGRLATLTVGSTTQTRGYDPDNRLTTITNGTDTTILDWDPTVPVPQLVDLTADTVATNLMGITGRWATMSKNLGNIALALDTRGSVLNTTATSSVARGTGYDIWGVPKGAATTTPQLGYRGEVITDTLIHLRARDYNPANPELTTPDPITGQPGQPTIANPYQYTLNNPATNTDPNGLFPTDSDIGARRSYSAFRVPSQPGYGRIRINLFIAAATSGIFPLIAYGNNRGFSPTGDVTDSKASITIDFESGAGLVAVNHTCWKSRPWPLAGGCFSAHPVVINPPTEMDPAACGTPESPPTFSECARAISDVQLPKSWVLVTGREPSLDLRYRFTIAGAPLNVAPAIEGRIGLTTVAGTDQVQWCVDRDPYPSLEIYQDIRGHTRTLARVKESGLPGPIALSGWVPSNTACGA